MTLRNPLGAFRHKQDSTLVAEQTTIYLVVFSTHCSGLTLRNSLSAFRHKQTFPPAHDSDRFQRLLYRSLHYFVKEIEHIFAIYFPSQLYTSH